MAIVKIIIAKVVTTITVNKVVIVKITIVKVAITITVNKVVITIKVDTITKEVTTKVVIITKVDIVKVKVAQILTNVAKNKIQIKASCQTRARALLHALNALNMKCLYPIQMNKFVLTNLWLMQVSAHAVKPTN